MRESRVDEAAPAQPDGQRRCSTCDVTWWGDDATACWFCGSPGAFASDTRRVVRDESAA
ncbi:MAG: hypothetical protein AAGA90_19395 [Actinomycetota bacterium]